MSIEEFCLTYRISRSGTYREAKANRLSIKKIGAASRIARSEAQRWAQNLPSLKGLNQ